MAITKNISEFSGLLFLLLFVGLLSSGRMNERSSDISLPSLKYKDANRGITCIDKETGKVCQVPLYIDNVIIQDRVPEDSLKKDLESIREIYIPLSE